MSDLPPAASDQMLYRFSGGKAVIHHDSIHPGGADLMLQEHHWNVLSGISQSIEPFYILFLLRIRVVSKGFHNDPIRLGRD